MNKRSTIAVVLLLAVISGGLLAWRFGYVPEIGKFFAAEPMSTAPNIVLILVDDLDRQIMGYFPRLKELMSDQGTTFNYFFAPNALCCPSRASILRGQYAHNHGVLNNNAYNGKPGGYAAFAALGHENSTIATWLSAANYRTALFGKYLNGYGYTPTVPPGWGRWYVNLGNGPGHSGYDYSMTENGIVVPYGHGPNDYLTDVVGRKATEYIALRLGPRPFFMYVAPPAPHNQVKPPTRYANEFPGVTAFRGGSFNEVDMSDKPLIMQNAPQVDPAGADALLRQRLQSMKAVEDLVANVIDALRRTGKLDNTYIFLTSDNGFHFGEHRYFSEKQTAYEEAIRVPLMVRGPGVPKGQVLDHFVLNHDLAATFADIAGATAPAFVDGKSIKPLLGAGVSNDQAAVNTWRKRVLIEYWTDDYGGANLAPVFGVRSREYVYIEHSTGEKELYNITADPYQMNSLHNDPAYAPVMAAQRARLGELRVCAGDVCRFQEGKTAQ